MASQGCNVVYLRYFKLTPLLTCTGKRLQSKNECPRQFSYTCKFRTRVGSLVKQIRAAKVPFSIFHLQAAPWTLCTAVLGTEFPNSTWLSLTSTFWDGLLPEKDQKLKQTSFREEGRKLAQAKGVEFSQKVDTGKRNTLLFQWKAKTEGSSVCYFS